MTMWTKVFQKNHQVTLGIKVDESKDFYVLVFDHSGNFQYLRIEYGPSYGHFRHFKLEKMPPKYRHIVEFGLEQFKTHFSHITTMDTNLRRDDGINWKLFSRKSWKYEPVDITKIP